MTLKNVDTQDRAIIAAVAGAKVNDQTILVTEDYPVFIWQEANRPINPRIMRKLDASYKKHGWLGSIFPILVTEKMVIIDGQHRLLFARNHNLPIYYLKTDLIQPLDSADIGTVQENWQPSDRLHYWCAMGFTDYLVLRDFWHSHRLLSLSEAARLCSKSGVRNVRFQDVFNRGGYKADNLVFAQKVYDMLGDFGRWVSFNRERSFIALVKALANNPKYDHDRMLRKMEYQYHKLVKQPNTKAYFVIVNEIYNNREPASSRIWIDQKV